MNNVKNLMVIALLLLSSVTGFTSCNDDDNVELNYVDIGLVCTPPDNLEGVKMNKIIIQLTDKTTMQTRDIAFNDTIDSSVHFNVKKGLYDLSLTANITYQTDGHEKTGQICGTLQSIEVIQQKTTLDISTYLYEVQHNFVLAEIFFRGSLTPEGKSYSADKYFRLYNNSSEALDAQGLAIAESEFSSTTKREYTPNIIDSDMAIGALYMIPRGTPIWVEPGGSLLLVDVAKDHTEANSNSFDEREADFEWYDDNPYYPDVDTETPNLVKLYCYTLSIWTPHSRGYKSYALAQIPASVTPENYVENYKYNYSYEFVNGDFHRTMNQESYRLPNSWIVDAVNLSVESEFQWIPIHPSLDKSYTYCGKINDSKTTYGMSVRRKTLPNNFLQDTNNSAIDFLPEQIADPYFKFHN